MVTRGFARAPQADGRFETRPRASMATQPQTQTETSKRVTTAEANEHAVVLAVAVAAIFLGGGIVAVGAALYTGTLSLAPALTPTSTLPTGVTVALTGIGCMVLGAVAYGHEWLAFP